jgi:hypothetical protein
MREVGEKEEREKKRYQFVDVLILLLIK